MHIYEKWSLATNRVSSGTMKYKEMGFQYKSQPEVGLSWLMCMRQNLMLCSLPESYSSSVVQLSRTNPLENIRHLGTARALCVLYTVLLQSLFWHFPHCYQCVQCIYNCSLMLEKNNLKWLDIRKCSHKGCMKCFATKDFKLYRVQFKSPNKT